MVLIGIPVIDFGFWMHVVSLPNVFTGCNIYKEPAGGMWGILSKKYLSTSVKYFVLEGSRNMANIMALN
jgi:hypothetical protein